MDLCDDDDKVAPSEPSPPGPPPPSEPWDSDVTGSIIGILNYIKNKLISIPGSLVELAKSGVLSYFVLIFSTIKIRRRVNPKKFMHKGCLINLGLHGIVGFAHYCGILSDYPIVYKASLVATKCFPIPWLVADLRQGRDPVTSNKAYLHLLAGVVPFIMAPVDDMHIVDVITFLNILTLAHFAYEKSSQWAVRTVAAALVTYYGIPLIASHYYEQSMPMFYPLGLAVLQYCILYTNKSFDTAAEEPENSWYAILLK